MADPRAQDAQLQRLILDNVDDLIAILDTTGKRLYNSPSYSKVLGDPSKLRGTDSFGEVHPEDRARLKQIFEETVRTGVGRRSEYRFVRPDGTVRYIESQSDVVKDAAGKTDKVIVVARDITDRKKAEEDIRTAYENLQALQSDLVQSEKLASIGTFAAGIVHDLKNPLSVASLALQVLRRAEKGGGVTDPIAIEALGLGEEGIQRATAMVQDLLSLSRRDDVQLIAGDFYAVIESSMAAIRHGGVPANIELRTSLEAKSARVLMDNDQMQQVLINLVSNAIQAMPSGGSITVKTTAASAEAATGGPHAKMFRPGQPLLVTEIIDTGTGISPEHLAKIWEPFFTTKPRGQGTGLGLAIVRTMVANHRGLIEVISQVGHGTTFRITLPLAQSSA